MPTWMQPESLNVLAVDMQHRLVEWTGAMREAQAPTSQQCLDAIQALHPLYAIGLGVAGLIYLLWGWRIFRLLVVVNAALIGAFLGGVLSVRLGYPGQWWIGLAAGAGLLGLLAWPLMRSFVGISGGVIGAVAGLVVWEQMVPVFGPKEWVSHAWIGAVIGALVVGLLAFAVLRLCVIVFTAGQGALAVTTAGMALLLKNPTLQTPLRTVALEEPHRLLLVVLGLTVGGILLQCAGLARKRKLRRQQEDDS